MVRKYVCPECGLDCFDYELSAHITAEHPEAIDAEQELVSIDRMVLYKSQQYDRICNTLFMSTGIINDGDSIRYIVDPETVCDELLKIILSDVSIDRDTIIKVKQTHYKNKGIKMEGW